MNQLVEPRNRARGCPRVHDALGHASAQQSLRPAELVARVLRARFRSAADVANRIANRTARVFISSLTLERLTMSLFRRTVVGHGALRRGR